MKTAIVLSGGGIKGAYQIGVWKALNKLKIKYDLVTGTSIGALNGILMVQKDYRKAMNIWKKIALSETSIEELNENSISDNFIDSIKLWKIKFSKIDYSTILFDQDTLKHREIKKSELDKNNLDLIITAAKQYPVIKSKKIEKKEYIDGGYFDSLPTNLAIEKGAERIITVDLKALGIKQILNPKDIQVDRIYPRNKINYEEFNEDICNKIIDYGYNDTMKFYGKLDGNKYTFLKGELKRNYDMYSGIIVDITKRLSWTDSLLLNAIISFNDINNILKEKDFSLLHNNIIEYLGKVYDIDESKIYNIDDFNGRLLYYFEEHGIVNKLDEKSVLDSKNVVSYIYGLLNSMDININKLVKLMLLYKKEFMGALYISALEK